MSGLHVYCLTAGAGPPVGLAGIGGRRVGGWSAGGLCAWASPLDASPAPDARLLRVHHDVVLTAFRDSAVLPVRFGQWLPDPDALATWLEREGERMRSELERLRDTVEFGVRVAQREEEPHAPTPPRHEQPEPREYLRTIARRRAAKREGLARRDAVVGRLSSAVGGLVREERVVPTAPGDLAAVAHLVDRARVEPYREAVARFFQRQAPFCAEVTGPWPPWSFVA